MEIIYDSGCATWEKGRSLGQNRGLELVGGCPLQNYCTGEICILVTPEKKDRNIVKQKLEGLHQELKHYART